MKKLLLTFYLLLFVFFNVLTALSEECITQEQLENEITKERNRWDVNNDNTYGIEDVIYALQLLSGFSSIEGLHFTWNGVNQLYYYVYLEENNTALISKYIQPNETDIHDLEPGDYRLVLNNPHGSLEDRTFHFNIKLEQGRLIIPSIGQLKFSWNGENNGYYYVYTEEDKRIISQSIQKDETYIHDLVPGNYSVVLNSPYGSIANRTYSFSITKNSETPIIPDLGNLKFTWNGENQVYYYVYPADDNTALISKYIQKNETDLHDLVPGDYRVVIDNDEIGVTIHKSQSYILDYPQ